MTTKEKILEALEGQKGQWFSGEELAGMTAVSRAAVWKAVKSLQGDGYEIRAVTNRGYSLAPDSDILSKQGILRYLRAMGDDGKYDLHVVPVTGSTNTDVRAAAQSGAAEGYAVIAAEQTRGSGRRGRSFYSPSGTGVYISILLRPENCPSEDAVRVTTIAAVAACRAIETVLNNQAGGSLENAGEPPQRGTGNAPGIKWVNDVYLRGKKVCGILTQGSFDMESGLLDYAVMGIGFNVYEPEGGFPAEIAGIAGPVFAAKAEDAKNMLAAAFLHSFSGQYGQLHSRGYAEEYRKRSIVPGREVRVLKGNEYREGPGAGRRAEAVAIDDDCRLLVRYEDGAEEWLSSGEISIRFSEVSDS